MNLPNTPLIPPDQITGEDDEDTTFLRNEHHYASDWLKGHRKWCGQIRQSWFVGGVAGLFTVHLFHITPLTPNTPDLMWVFYGDVPPAYLPTEDAPTLPQAIPLYLEECETWARHAISGKPLKDGLPILAPFNPEHGHMLQTRLQFIREHILLEDGTL